MSIRDRGHRGSLSLSERIYGCLLRAHPRRHREDYGDLMMLHCSELCQNAQREGTPALLWLWIKMLLPELLRDSAKERCKQSIVTLRMLAVPQRVVVLGALAAVVAGLLSMVSGILPYLKTSPSATRTLSWDLLWSLPWDLPVVGLPVVSEALVAVGCLGLYLLVRRRSYLALPGLVLVCSSMILSVASGLYENLVGPAYQWEMQPMRSVLEVDGLTRLVSGAETWLSVVGILALAMAALRTPILGRWRVMPFFLAAAQSSLIYYPSFALSAYMIEHASIEMVPLVLKTTPVLLHGPEVLVGLGWLLLGCVMWRKRRGTGARRARFRGSASSREDTSEA